MPEIQNDCIFMWSASGSTDISSFYYFDINLILLIVPAVKYVTYGCSSSRATPHVVTIHELHTGGKILLNP